QIHLPKDGCPPSPDISPRSPTRVVTRRRRHTSRRTAYRICGPTGHLHLRYKVMLTGIGSGAIGAILAPTCWFPDARKRLDSTPPTKDLKALHSDPDDSLEL